MQATDDFWTAILFSWSCPLLACQEVRAHRHSVCPGCGAVRFGNLSCRQCRLAHELALETLKLEEAVAS